MSASLRYLTLCLSGALLLGGVASCSKSSDDSAEAEWWRLEAERLELESEVELARMKAAGAEERKKSHARASELRTQLFELREQTADLEQRLVELEDINQQLSAAVDEQRAEMLAERRASHRGRNIEHFSGRDGRTYEDVRVKRVTPVGIEFSHSTGLARLTAAELSPAQRARFGLELDQATKLVAAEQRRRAAYLREAERAEAEAAQRRRERELELAKERRAAAERRLDQLIASNNRNNDAAARVSDNPLDQPARSVGPRRSSSRSSSFYTVWGPYRGSGCYTTPRRAYRATPYRSLRQSTRRTIPTPAPCP